MHCALTVVVVPEVVRPPVTKVEVVPAQVAQVTSESGPDETPKKKKSKKEKKEKKTKVEKPADDAAAAQEEEESEDPFEAAISRAKKLKGGIRGK